MRKHARLLGVFAAGAPLVLLEAQAPPAGADSHPVVESYYKIAPGKGDEWLELYRPSTCPS